MALVIQTPTPELLLANIKKAIDSGHIKTWAYDADGDFTHSPEQWRFHAWMRPIVASDILVFGIVGSTKVQMTKELYGVYHGRFSEALLAHFDLQFSSVSATALGDGSVDLFKTA